ncbi:ECF transporter S component [Streptococcus sp. 29896]|uniref:ECF transporter S component n=1 Tax=Streptococcus suivaginalis TaxID=3028082 RepID=A0AA96VE80_9STRE|nr:ECF transporter S component [Streptococcus sp. 29896]WNY47651.1 ECF transporter S component [Streptococcus sp. 29896]
MREVSKSQFISRIVMLSALTVALRFVFVAFPNIKPVTAIFLWVAYSWGLVDALLVMALSMLVSGIYLGFGMVVFWQIIAYGLVLAVWSKLLVPIFKFHTNFGKLEAVFAGALVFLYGFVISFLIAWQYSMPFFVYWLAGLSFDLAHALSTALFYPIIVTIFRRIL